MKNGACWLDDAGNPIQAHGGQIIRCGDTWYWCGEDKGADNCVVNGETLSRVDVIGVSCYSSRDLHTWRHEGVVLKATHKDPNHPLHFSRVLERPKVIYCEKMGKYVMPPFSRFARWEHLKPIDISLSEWLCCEGRRKRRVTPRKLFSEKAVLPDGRPSDQFRRLHIEKRRILQEIGCAISNIILYNYAANAILAKYEKRKCILCP